MRDALQRQLDAARDPATTTAELDGLADSFYPFVVLAVAENANTAPTTLARLAASALTPERYEAVLGGRRRDASTRAAYEPLLLSIARHPSTPLETLLDIAQRVRGRLSTSRENEQSAKVGLALIRRAEVPTEVVRDLLVDAATSTRFRAMVARETSRRDVRDLLAHDRSSRVRRALVRSSNSPG